MNKIFEIFNTYGKTVNYKKNDIVFNEHTLCDSVGLIIKGKVRITSITNDENEITINLLGSNDLFGDLLIFSSNPYYYGIGVCLENSVISFINKDKLMFLFKEDSLFLDRFLNLITNKGVYLKQLNKMYQYNLLEDRLMYYLNNLSKKVNENTVYYKSVTDISYILSVPRPSVSRSLHKLENSGKIKIYKHLIEIKK